MSSSEGGARMTGADDPRGLLSELFDAAVAAADPARLLPGRLPPPPAGRTIVVGAGKAAASMAAAVEREWDGPLEGLVVTRYGHGLPCERIEVVEAAHPVPDAAGPAVAGRILDLARGLGADDLLLCLISGGGSALLTLPAPGVTLEDKQAVSWSLLRSGATIVEMNCVRKHLSAIKGGRLAAAAHPAHVVTYLISDVPGDDPSVIASGPTVTDPTTFAEALDVLRRYGIAEPDEVLAHLRAGAAGAAAPAGPIAGAVPPETPKPGDPACVADEVVMLATAHDALEAAAGCARAAGVTPLILGGDLEGEARDLGGAHAALAIACARGGEAARVGLRETVARGTARADGAVLTVPQPPLVLLSGGETTVTVSGPGRGGRNTEYLLGLALVLDGHPAISALAGDTDGIDGSEDNAGAVVMPDTLTRARASGMDPIACLAANDAYEVFAALGDLVVTGPTRTNVNDFRAVLIV
jgi:glycerate 2-kinase